eukprot:1676067-Rhodomonas_salina.1
MRVGRTVGSQRQPDRKHVTLCEPWASARGGGMLGGGSRLRRRARREARRRTQRNRPTSARNCPGACETVSTQRKDERSQQ